MVSRLRGTLLVLSLGFTPHTFGKFELRHLEVDVQSWGWFCNPFALILNTPNPPNNEYLFIRELYLGGIFIITGLGVFRIRGKGLGGWVWLPQGFASESSEV